MQKGISGYNILTLLSMVDGKIHTKEDLVIRNWLIQQFDFTKNLDEEVEYLSKLKKAEYDAFLHTNMDLFYKNSSLEERNNLLQFAMNVIKADGKIKKGEHLYFDMLFEGWNEGE